jgi:hypothetical protein
MKHNVRCCCQPTKILGTLELPARVGPGHLQVLKHVVRAPAGPLPFTVTFPAPAKDATVMYASIELKTFQRVDGGSELAVYSDERPIDYWRTFHGFVEGDRV